MELLLMNWDIIIALLAIIIVAVYRAFKFIKQPSQKRQELILLWLIEAVTLAEEKYGDGTGKVKLSYVYKMFVDKFGVLGMFISQELFESLVEKALTEMNEILKKKLTVEKDEKE